MVKCCTIKNCKTVWTPNTKISFHNFPLKNPGLLAKWLKEIPSDLYNTPTLYTYVCSKHFLPECFLHRKVPPRKYIRKNAVPTLFGDAVAQSLVIFDTEESIEKTGADEIPINPTIAIKSDGSLCEKSISNNENEHCNTSLLESTSTLSSQKKSFSDASTQASLNYSQLYNREENLKQKLKIMRQCLRRRNEKMQLIMQLMKAMKSRMLRIQEKTRMLLNTTHIDESL